ncbi:hypothetical protein MMC25_005038 [Agyrium rufum]|nr:hypothetical protein [Agyrium rufum]
MSLLSTYESFLKRPSETQLSADAGLHYVSTLTSFHGPKSIVKHLQGQQTLLKKKAETVLSDVSGSNKLALEVETMLQFVNGGGAYLPDLDDNFVTDHSAVIPILHLVNFDESGAIQQIRLYWDQACLLRSVNIIGARGNNWPIKDGKDQINLINSSISVANKQHTNGSSNQAKVQKQEDVYTNSRPISPTKGGFKSGPRENLTLFERNALAEKEDTQKVAPYAPASAKPSAREYSELFVGQDPESPSKGASGKENVVAPKIGAGKNFRPSRLFEDDEAAESARPPPSPKKMQSGQREHFQFGEEEEKIPQPTKPRAKSKGASNLDFEEFNTPVKVPQKQHKQNVPSFSLGNDDEEEEPSKSHKPSHSYGGPSRGSQSQYEMRDDGNTEGSRRAAGNPRGPGPKFTNMSMHHNNFWDQNDHSNSPPSYSAANSGATSLQDRHKDFDPHFEIKDNSPGLAQKSASETNRPLPDGKSKALKTMAAQWEVHDSSPNEKPRGIKTAGDGMGGRLGGESARGKENMGIRIAGNGMGNRAGTTQRHWGFGDEEY